MADTVKVNIDGKEYDAPKGANLVDFAKSIGNDIPVFCYHPKMKPVGMCRMCLVEQGSIAKDRATGQVQLDDQGNPKIAWMPKMQTACTTNLTGDGMFFRTTTPQVAAARKNVIEFLLTSHPLDCPICDKGGECPLQNQTLEYGPGTSRMVFSDKMHLDKHVPLGDLIFLDEERCIQCARCIRFQDEIVGDPVLGFHERGRALQIITVSDPGFDTYFSGNTTDICPVGALTTEDFRFGARPWELTNVPSICPHCPVGCNTSLSTRLDRDFDGRAMIKRVMPRQNEQVNEIWICDKGRFGHHFTRSTERLMQPLINATKAGWPEALKAVADALKAGGEVAAIAGTQMSNEDLWALRKLVGEGRKGAWPPTHGGIELLAQVGVGKGTNLSKLGKGDAVLVIASDLEEEAPVWRLRLKTAHDRGAYVVVANARRTRMDDFASATVRYDVGQAAAAFSGNADVMGKLSGSTNLVIVAGADGLDFDGSRALMRAAANFLISSNHVGKPNNGLLATLPGANSMGLHYMGFSPEAAEDIMQAPPNVLIIAQADVLADDPNAAAWLDKVDTLIVLSLFPDELTARAKVVLPIQSFAERDGSFTNGERRVQRFYTAQGPMGSSLPAWQILSRVGEVMGKGRAKPSAAAVMLEIAQNVPAFAGATFGELAKVEHQVPDVGGNDLYYGGTAYKNTGGLGVQIATEADAGTAVTAGEVKPTSAPKVASGSLLIVPTTRLYNREETFRPSVEGLMANRTSAPYVEINSADAQKLKIADGDLVEVSVGASKVQVHAHVDGAAPQGTVLLPRHLSDAATPLAPAPGEVRKV